MNLQWILKKFDELSPYELYAILQLRNEVFVVEQNCVFQDTDNKDQSSFHFMAWDNDKLIGYTRIVPPGIIYEQASIGRVVTSPSVRSNGVGKMLVDNKEAPVLGNVCMDMTMLDISGTEVLEGDEVIVFGESLAVKDLANWANTIPYEILTGISQRVKRVYYEE